MAEIKFDWEFWKSVLDGLHANIYITDIATDEIVYMSDYLKNAFDLEHPEGQVCWKVLQNGLTERCSFCRIDELKERDEGEFCVWREHNSVTGRIYMNYDSLKMFEGHTYHIQQSFDITDHLQLSMEATVDELTGILNRNAGKRRLEEMLKSLKKEEQATVVLYDINGLKWVNDTFGHLEGDRLLKFIAKHIQTELEEQDFIFRLSGDEFIIVLAGKTISEAESYMKKILLDLENKRVAAGFQYDVTFSYGFAPVLAEHKLTVSDVLSIADSQMYIQKRDYHILKGKQFLDGRTTRGKALPSFQYNKDYLFDMLSESLEDYIFAGNLKTGKFMYSYKMMMDFGLPDQVIDDVAAFWSERVHPDDLEQFLRSNREIAEGKIERHAVMFRARNADGQWVHLMCKGQMARDVQGEPELFAGIIRNLSSGALDTNEELRIISDSSTDGIFKIALTKGIPVLYANDGYYAIHGYTKKQLAEELSNRIGLLLYEGDKDRVQREIISCVEQKESRVVLEYRIRRRDGSIAWVHMNAGLMQMESGPQVLIGMLMDITERRKLEERLLRTEQLFEVARKQTRLNMWQYDIRNRQIIQTEESMEVHGYDEVVSDVPEGLIANGYVHKNSEEAFRRLYQRVADGEPVVSEVVQTRRKGTQQEYWWQRITYTVVQYADGRPIWAIGSSEDITVQREAEARVFEEETLYQFLSEDLICRFRLNISQNRLEELWHYEENYAETELENADTEAMYQYILGSIANEDDRLRFQTEYHPEKLIGENNAGKELSDFEFRCKQKDGKIIWVVLNIRQMISPETGDRILFGYAKDIDILKKRELSLKKRAELDEVTGFYNASTAKLLIEELLEHADKTRGKSILMLLDIDDFRAINREGGFLTGDQILQIVSSELGMKVPASCIKTRMNGDLFMIFCSEFSQKRDIREWAEEIRRSLCRDYIVGDKTYSVTVSAGITERFSDSLTYDQMYQCALHALHAGKREGKNRLLMCHDVESREYRKVRMIQLRGDRGEKEQSAGGLELLTMLENYWIQMEKGGIQESSPQVFLEYIGSIFQACHVLLYKKENSSTQWKLDQTWSVNGFAEKSHGERCADALVHLLSGAVSEHTLLIEDESSEGYADAVRYYGDAKVPVPLVLCGINEGAELKTLIVLEHVQKHQDALKALSIAVRFLYHAGRMHELQNEYEHAVRYDQRTGLLNYESYQAYLHSANDDIHSAFGIVGAHLVSLKKFNQNYGEKAGNDMLMFAAKTVADIFGKEHSFRVSGAGFRMLCPDMTYENFADRCMRLETEIEAAYPGAFAFGSVWEQSAISVEKLQQQMEEKLQIARTTKRNANLDEYNHTAAEVLRGVEEAIAAGRFCTFLQPKAYVDSGEICGAEALVRYRHEEKGIIPPGKFLPIIERAGLVRYIDLFVLKDVCRIIREWLDAGWKGFPISLNYSRATILEPGILEETNRIVESMGVPKHLIEIEVTESIGSIDAVSLKAIVEQFVEAGYKISLDDFGAEYSNIYVLYSLRINSLKLDRRIVGDIYHDERARVVVENVIGICRKLGIVCVAEGVETGPHLGVLKDMSCDVMQGYYLNKPLPEKEFEKQYA